ncbi:MAG: RNA-binding protein [Legionellales bacterium]|nr:RNA-binding protein [Legionellales bacterium]|tara:strand:+ start:17445 stop:17732 length:288 start_codon:yes stop_codon:yes gene_type:complete
MSQSKIYVGNLSYGSTDEDLREFFAQYGDISEVKLITDRETGRSRGFAFVTFGNADAAKSALDADGTEFQSRRLKVSMAKEDGGGRRSGGGGNRF